MKAIRYIATIFLLATGVLHVFFFIQDPRAASSAAVLVFGSIYLVIGILIFLKMKYSQILGIIFPLIGLIYGLIAYDPKETTMLLNVLGIMDASVIILCSILLWDKRRMA